MATSPHAASSFLFQVRHMAGHGYYVEDADGQRVSAFTAFRHQAIQWRGEKQREADVKAKRGPRACLCCGGEFRSLGIHNRLCPGCRTRDAGDAPARPSIPSAYQRHPR